MKTFKKVLVGLLVVILVGVAAISIIGASMSGEMHVERQTVVNAPAEKIFPLIANMHNWTLWSPWHKLDPNMKIEYFGPETGVGAGYQWSGNKKVGKGKLTVVAYDQDKRLDTQMDFMENGTGKASFILQPEGAGTKLTWTMDSDMKQGGFPFSIIGPFFKGMAEKAVGEDYEKGLMGIKAQAEKL